MAAECTLAILQLFTAIVLANGSLRADSWSFHWCTGPGDVGQTSSNWLRCCLRVSACVNLVGGSGCQHYFSPAKSPVLCQHKPYVLTQVLD